MSKHSTTPRTLSRRLAALLAALALLAAMALPVYAEALDGATQMQETVETDNNGETDNKVETGSDVETDDKSETNEGTGVGADTESEDTNDNASQNPGANSTTPADNDPADAPDAQDPAAPDTAVAPNPAADAEETTAETTTAEQDVLFADGGNNDVTAPATSGYTLYFIAPTNWEENLSKADAHLYFNVNFHDNEWQQSAMTQIGTTVAGCRLYAINFVPNNGNTTICTCQFQCYVGTNHSGQQFQPIANTPTALTSLVGRVFDGTTQAWSDYQKEYAGKTLYFKNDSAADLTTVKAVFYTWDWQNNTHQQAAVQDVGTVAAGAQSEVLIPQTASGFVQFTWADGQSALYNYSNIQYTDENTAENGSTPLSIATQNRFTYGAEGSGIWDKVSNNVLAAGKTIYFDSTFSSYAYTGDKEIKQNPMPRTGDDGSAKMYCFLQTAENTFERVEMTPAPDPKAPGRQLWSYTIPKDKSYTAVQFSAWDNKDQTAKDDMTDVLSEDDIPANLKEPCFFADNGDPSAYKDGNPIYREGYWGEKSAVRDAESGKKSTVVDIASEKFTQEPATKYITSTLYDYYTDYELNGFNRDTYPDGNTISQRGFVTFEQFNRALSSAYTSGNVKYPLYTGHFQPSIDGWGNFFADVAKGMNLYGWSEPDHNKEAYINFMAVNNSALDTGLTNTDNNYTKTFQGLMEDKTSDGTKDGLPLLKGTTLVDPHFDKDFLQGKNAFNTVLGKVYEDVSFPLKQKAVFAQDPNNKSANDPESKAEYWYYDSNETSLYLKQDIARQSYYLAGNGTKDDASLNRGADNSTNGKGYGFFPFNETVGNGGSAPQYNYGFGAKLQFDFTLTEDGNVVVGKDTSGSDIKVPIKFFFSGDDDVWVYIDGELMLDVGGAHGKASGLLEFGANNKVTPYVSSNKNTDQNDTMVYKGYEPGETTKTVNYNGQPITFNKKGPTKTLKDQSTHTLTMYYMERGMWESNMALAFNFPDHNELQVEKQVDVSDVNPLFQASFKNQKIFTFNIQNLATHYETKGTDKPKIQTYELPNDVYSSVTGLLSYESSLPENVDKDKGSAVLWSSDKSDPSSLYRDQRRGTLTWDTAIDISPYSYLTFDVYVQGESTETCALSNLYVELWDTSGKQMGCLGTKGLQSSDVYGAATALHPGTWYTVRLMLNSLKQVEGFDKTQLKSITVGDNYARSIYLRNFTFSSAPAMPEQKGFTTAQYDIPDYGSAETGTLQNAAYAVFSSSDGTGNVVNENGDFLLEASETVTFNDQFRRGSYIALKELTDTELYDTSWTVYENGVPVTKVKGNKDVVETGRVDTLQNVNGTTPNDDRTEKVVDKDLDGNNTINAYTTPQKPADTDTLVFRSYSDKADPNELTKLKVVFTNKVKTGKLVIRKVPAADEKLEGKEFTFTVQFGDVGGQSLGDVIKPQEYTCKVEEHDGSYYGEIVIDKIPVGTRFVVSENPTNGTSLKSVQFKGGKDCAITEDGKRVRGAIVQDSPVTATFENTARELIDITVNKVWQKQDGTPMQENLPTAIYLRLQRTETPEKENTWLTVPEYENVKLQPKDYQGWIEQFTGLDKYDASKPETDRIPYTYRVLESASGDNNDWHGGVADDVIEIDGKKYTILNNTVQVEENSASPLALNLTNKQQDPKFTLDITKADAENGKTLLKDVEFTLEKLTKDNNGNTVADASFGTLKGKTNGQGKLMWKKDGSSEVEGFTELKAGTYRLTETKAAENYNLLSAPILVTFTTDGTCKLNGSKIEVSTTEKRTEFTKNEDGSYTLSLTVLNRKTPALPHTGADAPSLWLLIGLPLAVAGLLILVFRYNKKGGRTR